MTQPPKPRDALGRLLDQAKTDSGQEWLDVSLGSGLPASTIQSWVNGNTKNPPLRPVAHLAKYLKVEPAALAAAALEDYVAPIARGAGDAARREAIAALQEAERVALDAEAEVQRGRDQDDRKRPRSA